MRILILLADGFGARNFILTGFLKNLPNNTEVIFVNRITEELQIAYKSFLAAESCRAIVHWESFASNGDNSRLKAYLRKLITYSHMRNSSTTAHKLMLKHYVGNQDLKGRFLKAISRLFTGNYALNHLVTLASALEYRNREEVSYYTNLLTRYKPDVVISSSYWHPSVCLPILLAKDKQMPTVSFIPSWDNITSKSRITLPFDYYFVWGKTMKEEILALYPEIHTSQIKIVGTPQFDLYSSEAQRWTVDEFRRHYGLDQRPVILYASGAPVTNPDEPKYLEVLLREIKFGNIKDNPYVILRPAPSDDINRYSKVAGLYPELKISNPKWDTMSSGPLPEDPILLYNLIYHSNVIVNITSTITLDAATLDKPVVNPAFDVSSPLPHGIPLWDFHFQFEHYQHVVQTGAARVSRDVSSFVKDINEYLQNPARDAHQRLTFVKSQLDVPVGFSCKTVVEELGFIIDLGMGAKNAAIASIVI